MAQTILVTGGAGYIGSHTVLVLLEAGFDVVVLDNLSNSSAESLERVARLTGRRPAFVRGDIRDQAEVARLMQAYRPSAVLHFAGLKAVGESVEKPLMYYEHNVAGTIALCSAMAQAGVFTLGFSSSATVYGTPDVVPISEEHPTGQPTNPYGRSKLMVEQILQDVAASDERWSIGLLRYFNPVGAHPSGLIGEDPNGVPNNLLPYITQVAVGRLQQLSVFGNDYDTVDRTGVRDYIHVMDLAEGHLEALRGLADRQGVHVWNLGTGKGYSVLEILAAFEQVSGQRVPYRVVARRPGDVAACYADPAKARRDLGWFTRRGLHQMLEDAWRWQSSNPEGYGSGT